ncbi:Swt1 family HEPN domain-containing protein [Candidatus Omnitrophota bacterium]
MIRRWGNWRLSNLKYEDASFNAKLSSTIDDCLIDGDCYIPIDYKTTGRKLSYDPIPFYQIYLDSFCLMLNASGFKTKNLAYLIYFYPEGVTEEETTEEMVTEEVLSEDAQFKFGVDVLEVKTDPTNALKTFMSALVVLRGAIPERSPNCEYCQWSSEEIPQSIFDAERALSRLVEATLQETYGKDWWVEGVPEKIRIGAVSRRERELSCGIEAESPFSYLFLIELKDILVSNWKLFQPILKEDPSQKKDERLKWIDELNGLRNRLAHPRRKPLSRSEETFILQTKSKIKDFSIFI